MQSLPVSFFFFGGIHDLTRGIFSQYFISVGELAQYKITIEAYTDNHLSKREVDILR